MGLDVLCDLRKHFGPARDQGERPTCLAFAASDTHAALRNPWRALSSEFVFYHAQRRAGRPLSSGAVLPAVLTALKSDGQPIESDWPYFTALPEDLDDYGPPENVALYRRDSEIGPIGLDEIVGHLDAGRPSIALMMLSDAIYLPDTEGVVRAPPDEAPDPTRRHAVVLVGHGQLDGVRAILIRNSWGADWGIGGNAWLPEPFITPRLTHIALLTEEVHVHGQNLAA